jgi:hypothetical protein
VICFALCPTLSVLASQAMASAQTYGPVLKLGTPLDESTMGANPTHYVAPVYPKQVRLGHIEGSIVLHANTDARGRSTADDFRQSVAYPSGVRSREAMGIEQTEIDGSAALAVF